MSTSLSDQRFAAAVASNQTSYPVIKQTILKLIEQRDLRGRFLDMGAGRGDLLKLVKTTGRATALVGVDMMPRPDDLPSDLDWYAQDLNDAFKMGQQFDVVTCSEVIEHLENPRALFRNLRDLLVPGGTLILTMPNQESLKSFIAVLFFGHFSAFLGEWYPAHITALLRLDLIRLCRETGFADPVFAYTNEGTIPKLPRVSWQAISWGLLRGRLFSDNIAMVTQRR